MATDPCSRVILCLVSCKSWNATDQELARLGIPTMNSTQRRSQSHNSRFPRILWIHKTSDIIVSFFFGIHPLSVKEEGKIQDIQSLINYLIRSSSLLFLFLMYFFVHEEKLQSHVVIQYLEFDVHTDVVELTMLR